MTASELCDYLHSHIPITRAMAVAVRSACFEQVELSAPLAPNINHHASVFGGSAASLATLACWALLHARLQANGVEATLVIQKSTLDYLKLIDDDFVARCASDDDAAWQRLLTMITRKGRGRMTLESQLVCNGEIVATFRGEFVALADG